MQMGKMARTKPLEQKLTCSIKALFVDQDGHQDHGCFIFLAYTHAPRFPWLKLFFLGFNRLLVSESV